MAKEDKKRQAQSVSKEDLAQQKMMLEIDKDNLITENRRLNQEIASLSRTLMADNGYINYLLTSKWWKISAPIRTLWVWAKKKKHLDYEFVKEIQPNSKLEAIKDKISVIIYTYNAGEEFTVQLKNITNQKLIKNIEIILIDNGSKDNTIKYAEQVGAKVIKGSTKLSKDELYINCLSQINGKYVVVLEQNNVIDSKYWLYQALKPIRDKKATTALFYDRDMAGIKQTFYYEELKQRIGKIGDKEVLFLPVDRNTIYFLNPAVLEGVVAIVRERKFNMTLL